MSFKKTYQLIEQITTHSRDIEIRPPEINCNIPPRSSLVSTIVGLDGRSLQKLTRLLKGRKEDAKKTTTSK